MSFNPNEFLSHINLNNGLSKPSKFQVQINIPLPLVKTVDVGTANFYELSRSLSLQCETAELPGKNLITDDVKIYGPTFKIPYQTQYNDISLTFLCTGNFYERSLFDAWINMIMPTDTNNLRFPKGSGIDSTGADGYLTEIIIKQYDDIENEIYNVKLIDAFPTGIQAQSLSWSDDGFHRLTVVFSYLRYVTERKSVNPGEEYVSDDSSNVEPERAGGYVATNYLGGHDGGDNPQNAEPGKPYAGGGVLSGLITAAVGGLALNLVSEALGRGSAFGPSSDSNNSVPEGKDYLGGHDGGDNPENAESGRPYAGGGVLSGLVTAAVGGLALNLVSEALGRGSAFGGRGGSGGGPAVGQNYTDRGTTTPPAGRPYGER